jgi:hypothetical protein
MDSIITWAKSHPYLLGSVVLALVVLWSLFSSSSSTATTSTAATTTASGTPDDSVQEAEIAAGTTVAQTQLALNGQVAQYNEQGNVAALQATSANLQTSAGVQENNENTQASLTLGLAQAGQGTTSILELLGGQPDASPITQQLVVSGIGAGTPTSSNSGGGSISSSGGVSTGSIGQSGQTQTGTTSTGGTYTGGPVTSTSQQNTSDPGQIAQLYDPDVTGTDEETGETYGINPIYSASPTAAADFASILGLQTASTGPIGGVGSTGGIFVNPSATGVVVSQGTPTGAGVANEGQIIAGLQSTAPGTWATQLAGYGINLTSDEENEIYNMFGSNQAVPAGD